MIDRNVELIRWRNYFLKKTKYSVKVPRKAGISKKNKKGGENGKSTCKR